MRSWRQRLLAAAGALACLLSPAAARAWDNQGHMATGAIAYDDLKRLDPQGLERLLRLAAAHPDRARLDARLAGLSGPARDRALFEWLARWPDDVRDTAYDHPDWHYAVKLIPPVGLALPFVAGKARQAFDAQMAILANPAAPPRDRAVALAWVLHLTGDIHQPLHAGHDWWWRFPKTDRAGTIGYVRGRPGGRVRSLHEFWDEGVDGPPPEGPAAEALVARLEARYPQPAPPSTQAYDRLFRGWMAESYDLARTVAYRGPALAESPTPDAAPVLTPAYVAQVRAVGDRRVAQAGHRLADVLRRAVAKG